MLSTFLSSIERNIGASSPAKTDPVVIVEPVEELIFQENVTLPDDVFSDIVLVDEIVPDDISSPDELILSALPDDVDQEFEIFSDPDDMMVPEKLTLFHELVTSIIHEEVDHVVHKVFHELVVLPDDVDPENAISPSHSDQLDVSHEAELHDSLMATVVQVVDPVESTTAEQLWSEGVYKIGTHLVVFVYCFSSIAIQVLDRIVRVSFVLLS